MRCCSLFTGKAAWTVVAPHAASIIEGTGRAPTGSSRPVGTGATGVDRAGDAHAGDRCTGDAHAHLLTMLAHCDD